MKSVINIGKRSGFGLRRSSTSTASTVVQNATKAAATKQGNGAPTANQTVTNQTQKTQAQLDEDLQQKLAALSGDGGDAGVEYEDGKPVAMKRGVRENMFRYI